MVLPRREWAVAALVTGLMASGCATTPPPDDTAVPLPATSTSTSTASAVPSRSTVGPTPAKVTSATPTKISATWMRGIDVIQVPTTVLAMADAAIGGKTGINIPAGKNLVGAFHEPIGVLCDTDLLRTLPVREVRSGLAEIVKCGFIEDPVILDLISDDPRAGLDVTSQTFVEMLTRAITVKAGVVSADLQERTSSGSEVGRERLNYGHTLAHAIEAHKHFTWRHGEADAVGMVFAAELSHRYLGLPDEVVTRTRAILSAIGLPVTCDEVAWADLREMINLDKKTRVDPQTGRRVLRFVGIHKPGQVAMIVDPDEAALAECYDRCLAR